MSDAFLGEIKLVAFNFPPRGWALCDGAILSISQNQALFSLLGTQYGGNGQTNFALPDLRGRTPLHMGTHFPLGAAGGERTHALTVAEMPAHLHMAMGNDAAATQSDPAGKVWSKGGDNIYSDQASDAQMKAGAIGNAGSGQPHNNMSPYLVLNFVICISGLFPSRN